MEKDLIQFKKNLKSNYTPKINLTFTRFVFECRSDFGDHPNNIVVLTIK